MASDELAAAALLATVLIPGSRRWFGVSAVERREVEALNADLYLPRRRPAPGIVLALGALREGRRYPILESTARAVAARGFAVLVPEIGRLRDLVLGVDALDDLIAAARGLPSQEGVMNRSVGLIGFSLGGSLALVAAGDQRLRDRVACVAAMGSYFRLTDMLDAAVRGFTGPGSTEMALAAPSAYAVVASLAARLPEPDREVLERMIGRDPESPVEALQQVELSAVGPQAQAVVKLLRNRDPASSVALIQKVDGLAGVMAALSPSQAIGRIQAPVWVLHDERDRYVPFDQFRAMREAARGRANFKFLGIRLLEHTEPTSPVLNPRMLLRDYLPGLAGLYRFAYGALRGVRRPSNSEPVGE